MKYFQEKCAELGKTSPLIQCCALQFGIFAGALGAEARTEPAGTARSAVSVRMRFAGGGVISKRNVPSSALS